MVCPFCGSTYTKTIAKDDTQKGFVSRTMLCGMCERDFDTSECLYTSKPVSVVNNFGKENEEGQVFDETIFLSSILRLSNDIETMKMANAALNAFKDMIDFMIYNREENPENLKIILDKNGKGIGTQFEGEDFAFAASGTGKSTTKEKASEYRVSREDLIKFTIKSMWDYKDSVDLPKNKKEHLENVIFTYALRCDGEQFLPGIADPEHADSNAARQEFLNNLRKEREN